MFPGSSFPIHNRRYRPQHAYLFGPVIVLFLLTVLTASAQNPLKLDKTVYTVVKKQPEFPGGFGALQTYLKQNVHYPTEAQKAGVKGRVFVSFIIETDGQITDVQLLKGLGYGCDEESLRVIRAMPRWTPGSQDGRPLRVRYHLPVLFGVDYPKYREPSNDKAPPPEIQSCTFGPVETQPDTSPQLIDLN